MGKVQQYFIIFVFLCLGGNIAFAQWEQPDTIWVQMDDCNTMGTWCVDIPRGDIDNYTISVNGEAYMGTLEGCALDTFVAMSYFNTFGQGQVGPYFLESWNVDGNTFSGEFMNIAALVDSMNVWDPDGQWEDRPDNFHIFGGNPHSTYSDMVVTVVAINLPSTIVANLSFSEPRGTQIAFENGIHEMEITENLSGTTQTSIILSSCHSDLTEATTLDVGTSETFCLEPADFGFLGAIAETNTICTPDASLVTFNLVDNCVMATPNAVGVDTACYQICDEYGFCAMFTYIVTGDSDTGVLQQETIYNVPVYTDGSHCFDLSELNGDLTDITVFCDDANGEHVAFDMLDEATYCINFNTLQIGTDTICYHFTDTQGIVLATTLIVAVTPPPPATEEITLLVGETQEICFDTSQLSGPIFNVFNDCENSSNNSVLFEINNVSLCANMEAITHGLDTACIVLCDQNSVCDTTYYIINATNDIENFAPVAVDDVSQTHHNTSVVINICNNDLVPGNNLTDYGIVPLVDGGVGLLYGTVVFNDDCTVTYTPNTDAPCEVSDSFTYFVCNEVGCSEAYVEITLACVSSESDTLMFYSGFSPNGDNINETFVIEGIESFPNNQLFVFNRWGNEVYRENNYRNDWNGTWNGGILPDGTYFYYVDTGNGKTYSGYVQIQR